MTAFAIPHYIRRGDQRYDQWEDAAMWLDTFIEDRAEPLAAFMVRQGREDNLFGVGFDLLQDLIRRRVLSPHHPVGFALAYVMEFHSCTAANRLPHQELRSL